MQLVENYFYIKYNELNYGENMGNEAKLALEDGTVLKGKAFGYETVTVGELAFSTGMSGYTEALTDPSFKGQILMSTYPLEGNYGVSEDWYQSDKVQVEGFVVREACKKLSNFGTKLFKRIQGAWN